VRGDRLEALELADALLDAGAIFAEGGWEEVRPGGGIPALAASPIG
jgi:hypothetical protein